MRTLIVITIFVLFTLVAVNSAPVPGCIETYLYDPVCASNGKTYQNKMFFNCVSQSREARGLPGLRIIREGNC